MHISVKSFLIHKLMKIHFFDWIKRQFCYSLSKPMGYMAILLRNFFSLDEVRKLLILHIDG